jgi:hypothetical protein
MKSVKILYWYLNSIARLHVFCLRIVIIATKLTKGINNSLAFSHCFQLLDKGLESAEYVPERKGT